MNALEIVALVMRMDTLVWFVTLRFVIVFDVESKLFVVMLKALAVFKTVTPETNNVVEEVLMDTVLLARMFAMVAETVEVLILTEVLDRRVPVLILVAMAFVTARLPILESFALIALNDEDPLISIFPTVMLPSTLRWSLI